MIDRREILETASSFSLLPSIVEKDYVLGWMLAVLLRRSICTRRKTAMKHWRRRGNTLQR